MIVLDEATSALDNNTEKLVMNAISGLNKDTILVIMAHRLSTLQCCDRILIRNRIFVSYKYSNLILAIPLELD